MQQRFVEDASLEDFYKLIERTKKKQRTNIWFALSSFQTPHSRKGENSLYIKSFFLDIDVGKPNNSYPTREEAQEAVLKWIETVGLPEPTVVDSGNGYHVYWILKEEITTDEWQPYADRIKELCIQHKLIIDPVVPADRARILRIPGTLNFGKHCDEPNPATAEVITDIYTYSLEEIASCLGEVAKPVAEFNLSQVKKGLDDETKDFLGYPNYESEFRELAEKSLAGEGCNQIKWMLENAASCSESLWYAGLSVAVRCIDGDTAIHLLSEDYPDYTFEETERKAQQSLNAARWAHGCDKFEAANPGGCEGCPYKGNVKGSSPIGIVARLKVAEPSTDAPAETADTEEDSKAFPKEFLKLPDSLFPFMRPINGGIYYQPAPAKGANKEEVAQPPYQIYPYDLIPIKRLTSPYDGESLHLRHWTPKDGVHDYIFPLKLLGAPDKYKEFLFSNGIVLTGKNPDILKDYFMKWASYYIHRRKAEDMRVQMGWTSSAYDTFVAGTTEITEKGNFDCPTSPAIHNVAPHIRQEGSFSGWRGAAEQLMQEGFQFHRFSLLTGFGSVLVPMTNIGGLVISLSGEKGAGKTGALQAGLSVFGDPVKLKITTEEGGTINGLFSRATTLKNILLGIDETSNFKPEIVSKAVFRLPMNEQPKIRLMSSYNVERKVGEGSSQLVLMTTNQSNKQKLFANGKANPEGELRRLLEFDMYKPPGGLAESRGQLLFEPFKNHFGHAGPMFIRSIYDVGVDRVKQMVSDWKTRFLKDFIDETAYSYWTGGLAAVFAAGELAVKNKIIDYDIEELYRFILEKLHAMHNETTKTTISYEDLINEFIITNMTSTLMIDQDSGKIAMEPRSDSLLIRIEINSGSVFISSAALKKHLEKLQVNSAHFENVLLNKNVLRKGGGEKTAPYKMRLGTGWKNGVANIRCYEFKLDVSDIVNQETSDD